MRLFLGLLCLAGLGLGTARAADAKAVKFSKQWKGSVDDEALQKVGPEVIANAKTLAELWKAWKVEGKAPKVDFDKEIVIVQTAGGSRINVGDARLDEKGNLQVLGMATLDLAPGFRYVIGTISRDGVKSVNGKELPKD